MATATNHVTEWAEAQKPRGLVRYPCQLSDGTMVRLDLPAALTHADIDRIERILRTLVVPAE
jgi:hypothetical protein